MKKVLFAFLSGLMLAAGSAELKHCANPAGQSAEFTRLIDGGDYIKLPPGRYEIAEPLTVKRDLTLIFENGAVLTGKLPTLIRHLGGTLILQGIGKPGELVNTANGQRGQSSAQRASAIDLNKNSGGTLKVRNMTIRSFNGIDGYLKEADRKPIASIDIAESRFECREKSAAFANAELGNLVIRNCEFEGADEPIHFDCPMPGGAAVCENTLRNFGRRGILLGKSGQIADGCTRHLPNAVVQNNRLLRGGLGATEKDSYIHGILIYGHDISVQGNIVRDVNRGEPVPGEAVGRQMRTADGKILRGHWIDTDEKKHRRLAGAAIYLKATRAIVQGNICENSGWRSVIEIKTGGKEHFVTVVNNVVDGHALAIDESFGFECNSGRSLWAGNVVHDMPQEAFVVRSGFNNSFMNNLISNARIGFALSGPVPGQGELIAGNRFINVEYPVVDEGTTKPAGGADIHLPATVYMDDPEDLPEPAADWFGRQVVLGERLLLCVRAEDGSYRWKELTGALLPVRKYQTDGEELALPSIVPAQGSGLAENWTLRMVSSAEKPIDPSEGHFGYEEATPKSPRSLRIAMRDVSGNWQIERSLELQPGTRYRASVTVRSEEPLNLRLSIFTAADKAFQTRATNTHDRQTLQVDFITPPKSGQVRLRLWGSKCSAGKASLIESVSVRRLTEEGEENQKKMQPAGPELAWNPDQSQDAALPDKSLNNPAYRGWTIAPQTAKFDSSYDCKNFKSGTRSLQIVYRGTPGNLMLQQTHKLAPGKRYRAEICFRSPTSGKWRLNIRTADRKTISAPTAENKDFHIRQIDFTTPSDDGTTALRCWGSGLQDGDSILIDRVSLRELRQP